MIATTCKKQTNIKIRSYSPGIHMNIIGQNILKPLNIFLVLVAVLFAANAGAAVGDSSGPIHIEADRMVSQEQKNSVVFIGNVEARQGDLVIRTDEMTVFYEQKDDDGSKKSAGQVKKLICKGNVEISQGDWLGTGKRMDYYALDRKVILSGEAKGWQGQNMVAGKTITYYLDEGRSIVEGPATAETASGQKGSGQPGRVKAVIHPDAEQK